MKPFSLHELVCLDAVVSEGGFHAAADKLHRSHSTIFSAVKNLEENIGITLLDRSEYRVKLTQDGQVFYERARNFLRDAKMLHEFAQQISGGNESDLRVAVSSLCPAGTVAGLFNAFSNKFPELQTRFHFYHEAVSGTLERLLDGDVDIIFGPVDSRDPRLDKLPLFNVDLIPVVAPGFLDFSITADIGPKEMRNYLQAIIRDSSRKENSKSYFIMEGGKNWTVADQQMKKSLIVQGSAWGHMPSYLVNEELADGRLLSIEGNYFKTTSIEIFVARAHESARGPVAQKLWDFLSTQMNIR